MAIGTSFVITKKVRLLHLESTDRRKQGPGNLDRAQALATTGGLMHASEQHGFEGEGFSYLKSPIWWGGIVMLGIGEICNFSAYAFAPAILVTPLGALSVLIGAVLGSYFLNERLGTLGKLGCAMCLLGSVVIVLHAPPDKPVDRIDEILAYAVKPGFLLYCLAVAIFSSVMIYRVAPVHGKKNPLIFISICSTVGSVSVMSIKAFGIAVKLTLGGNNQFTHASTYVFAIVTGFCILTQMNYFNKALNSFSTSIVNPLYYVTFTTATLCASFILFQGFNTTDAVNTISLLCGFLIIFTGVYLLNLSRHDPDGRSMVNSKLDEEGVPTDGIAGYQTRRSMQSRRSSSSIAYINGHGDREGLIHSYDIENNQGINLDDLAEESDGEPGPTYGHNDERDRTALHTKRNSQV
ncbi:magnesium transporter NIPA5 [Penicillium macrosclerotiorum]|uniref:magnesium transporter NIPA5 n=1 Tax=Penicillium macrosclerotiorum TaxID=303699 RepID=UPI0025488D0E|nr:magnesium transporter NIPA5 [Penicillium macrosclerotiorum]KAJ5682818.1 magnesium transporter NIPA5 [Penicillium macrosclerotiorum]